MREAEKESSANWNVQRLVGGGCWYVCYAEGTNTPASTGCELALHGQVILQWPSAGIASLTSPPGPRWMEQDKLD